MRPDVERIYIKSPRLNTHTPYHVRFSVNRESIAHAQHALQLCLQDPDFPPLAPLILPFELPSVLEETEPVGFERKDGQLNEEQLEAVSQILLRTQLRREEESEEPLPPYIIFGPPGTGKTKTLVEAIFQVRDCPLFVVSLRVLHSEFRFLDSDFWDFEDWTPICS